MKTNFKQILFGTALLLAGQSCTDLTETTYDVIPTDRFGSTPEQQAALLGPLYSSLGETVGEGGYFGNYAALNTVTDEQVIPTRGGDWKDGDAWKRLKEHTWTATGDDSRFNNVWTWCYNSITSINAQLNNPQITETSTKAELRALRAFYHYVALDHFRNVIIADKLGGASPAQTTGAETFSWIEKELKEVYPLLNTTVGGVQYGRQHGSC
jgi:hypothetical protein